jgi:ATP-dependent RNA helicase DDX3X
MNYDRPTPIQKHAVPLVLGGRDVMCCAQTGSGKTCAFLLPTIVSVANEGVVGGVGGGARGGDGRARPAIVVLAPTRELASQIHLEARKLCAGSSVRSVCVYGGAKARGQLQELAWGVDVLVATPGRLTDFVERNLITFEDVRYLILDEADRMLDMGTFYGFFKLKVV